MTDTNKTKQEPRSGLSDLTVGLDADLCKCGKNPATESHSCPYAEDIGDNDDPDYCTCCDDCRHECCMDI